MAVFALAHMSCGGAWCWDAVAARLRAAGHEVHAPDLDLRPGATPARHAAQIGDGDVVAGHSHGAAPASAAAAHFGALVVIDGPVADDGDSMHGLRPQHADERRAMGELWLPPDPLPRMRPMPLSAMEAPVRGADAGRGGAGAAPWRARRAAPLAAGRRRGDHRGHRRRGDPALEPRPVAVRARAERFLEAEPGAALRGEAFSFCCADPATDAVLGGVGLFGIDVELRIAVIGYWTAPWARRRGVAAAAVEALASWAFAAHGLARIDLTIDAANPPSRGVAERVDAVRDGDRYALYPR